MRAIKTAAVIAMFVLSISLLAAAERNKFGVSDTQKVTFNEPIRVGDVVLPKGEYKVQHTMKNKPASRTPRRFTIVIATRIAKQSATV